MCCLLAPALPRGDDMCHRARSTVYMHSFNGGRVQPLLTCPAAPSWPLLSAGHVSRTCYAPIVSRCSHQDRQTHTGRHTLADTHWQTAQDSSCPFIVARVASAASRLAPLEWHGAPARRIIRFYYACTLRALSNNIVPDVLRTLAALYYDRDLHAARLAHEPCLKKGPPQPRRTSPRASLLSRYPRLYFLFLFP